MGPGKGYASKVTWYPEGEKMSLVHNCETWIGPRPRDRELDADAPVPVSAMASEPLKMRGAHKQDTRSPGAIEKGREILTPFYSKVCKPRAMFLGSGNHSLGLI